MRRLTQQAGDGITSGLICLILELVAGKVKVNAPYSTRDSRWGAHLPLGREPIGR